MTQLPHAFKRLRLELARSKEFPNGSANHGYEFIAPLDADAHIDPVLWQKYRENCRVVGSGATARRSDIICTRLADQSTRAGSSITTGQHNMKTSMGIDLEPILFVLANTFRSKTKLASPTHFEWFR